MFSLSRRSGSVLRKSPRARRLAVEPLEDRRLLAVGDLLQTFADPSTQAQGGSKFGSGVATDGTFSVVGTPDAALNGLDDVGRAYVFNSSTGALVATLNNPAPAGAGNFGQSVAISAGRVVVGAPNDSGAAMWAGAAYVFDATTGALLSTLHNPTPAASDYFGFSVAISGSTAVVGAHYDDASATDAGSAYVFDAASGNLLRTLNNPTPASYDAFGRAVAISGSTIVVGAQYDGTGAASAGSAYVFDAATGNLLRTLNNPAPAPNDCFGASVAVAGSTVVVGAPGDDWTTSTAGAAYVYDASAGNLLRKLGNPIAAIDNFAWSVAVSGSTVVVGAFSEDTGASDAGSAYVFNGSTGTLLRTLHDPLPAAQDYFAFSVAVSGNTLVAGTPCYRTDMPGPGSACVFDATTGALLRTLNNPTPAAKDRFGSSVAISGGKTVVGAPYDDSGATDSGAAYVLDTATGALLWKLNNPTPAAGDQFGANVAVSGNTVVVGAPFDGTGATWTGSAYVFDATTGNLLRTLNNPTPEESDRFGCSVAVAGSTVVVGAWCNNSGATASGSAYVFDAASGNLLRTLDNPTPATFDEFGYCVAVSGSTVVVGASGDDTGATDAGSAYVYDAATGNLLRTLNNPTPAYQDFFGTSVAVSGGAVLVGASQDDTGAENAGAVYAFDAATGNLLRTISNPTPAAWDRFGSSVAVSGNAVVVGVSLDSWVTTEAGSACVFDATTGNLLATLHAPAPEANDGFGSSVAVSGNRALVGAPLVDGGTIYRGAAYAFDAALSAPDLRGGLVDVPSTLGWGQTFTANFQVRNDGAADVTSDFIQNFYLSADQVWGNADDVLLAMAIPVTADVPGLGTSAGLSVQLKLPATAPAAYTGAGPFYVGMYTESGGTIAESNELNNRPFSFPLGSDSDSFTVNVGTADLQGAFCDVPSSLKWNQAFSAQYQVKNAGTAAVTADFTQSFYLSKDAVFDSGDVLVGSVTCTADVAAGATTAKLTASLRMPATPPAGWAKSARLYFGMYTDSALTIAESNETNNRPFSFGLNKDCDRAIVSGTAAAKADLTAAVALELSRVSTVQGLTSVASKKDSDLAVDLILRRL